LQATAIQSRGDKRGGVWEKGLLRIQRGDYEWKLIEIPICRKNGKKSVMNSFIIFGTAERTRENYEVLIFHFIIPWELIDNSNFPEF
jgi:hypothetical protein